MNRMRRHRRPIYRCLRRPPRNEISRIAPLNRQFHRITGINQSDVLAEGKATAVTGVKIGLNFVVPFVVSNLGVLAASKTMHEG